MRRWWTDRVHRGERGQVLPPLLLLVIVIVAGAIAILQVGRASALRAEAVTAADAAALAAVDDVRKQIEEQITTTGTYNPHLIQVPRLEVAARSWASRNGGTVSRLVYNPMDLTVRVWVRSTDAIARSGDPDGMGGELNDELREEGATRAEGKARAKLELTFNFPGLPGGGVGGGLGLPRTELDDLAAKAGVPVRDDSALRRYGGDCASGSKDIHRLTDAMKIAILKAEDEMGAPLVINSAYRDPQRCQPSSGVGGFLAPPGMSLHNYGQAIDVQNWQALLAATNRNPGIGLCWPFPGDHVHFSLSGGRECGGRTGGPGGGRGWGGGGGAFPGGISSFVTFDSRLVQW